MIPTLLGAAVLEALRIRKMTGAAGPRTSADLARALNVNPGSLHHVLHKGNRMTPSEDDIRALLPEV